MITAQGRLTSIYRLRRRLRRYRRLIQARHMRRVGMSRLSIVFSVYPMCDGGFANGYLDRCFRLVIVIIEKAPGVVYLSNNANAAK